MDDGMWFELTIRYLGIAMFSYILLAATVGAGLVIAAVVVRFTPRLHYGRPQNPGELRFYEPRAITTGKDGGHVDASPRLLNDPLRIRWWFGLSCRPRARWWIGLIRFEPKAD